LERSGGAIRKNRDGATGAEHGFARGSTGISQWAACGEGDFYYVVAYIEEDDCAGLGGTRVCSAGDIVTNGNDGGGGTAHGVGESGAAAIFQSDAEDGDAGSLKDLQWRVALRPGLTAPAVLLCGRPARDQLSIDVD